jgi:hypothetical protein
MSIKHSIIFHPQLETTKQLAIDPFQCNILEIFSKRIAFMGELKEIDITQVVKVLPIEPSENN